MAGEIDEFELFRARALGGGIAPLPRQVQSLPSTPPGTPDRIREEEDDDEEEERTHSPSGSIGSGHHRHHITTGTAVGGVRPVQGPCRPS
jgi:hypothetical protein